MTCKLQPYDMKSKTARDLARLLGIKMLKPDGKWVAKEGDVVINWGSCRRPKRLADATIINEPLSVELASNKISYFEAMEEWDYMPCFTTDLITARDYMDQKGCDMVERHQVRGSRGRGIRVVQHSKDLQRAPLYVEYIKKREEYRIHVMNGEIISKNKKGIRNGDRGNVNYQIRNYHEGWIYLRDREVPNEVCNVSLQAIETLGLDFGAVDVLWNQKHERAVPIEVNTAPGLTASLLHLYQERFREFIFQIE